MYAFLADNIIYKKRGDLLEWIRSSTKSPHGDFRASLIEETLVREERKCGVVRKKPNQCLKP